MHHRAERLPGRILLGAVLVGRGMRCGRCLRHPRPRRRKPLLRHLQHQRRLPVRVHLQLERQRHLGLHDHLHPAVTVTDRPHGKRAAWPRSAAGFWRPMSGRHALAGLRAVLRGRATRSASAGGASPATPGGSRREWTPSFLKTLASWFATVRLETPRRAAMSAFESPAAASAVACLADVLLRVQTHPESRIDELLPHKRTPPRPEPSA